MTWLTWLLLALIIAAVAAVTGIKAKGTRLVAGTRLMGVLLIIIVGIAYAAYGPAPAADIRRPSAIAENSG